MILAIVNDQKNLEFVRNTVMYKSKDLWRKQRKEEKENDLSDVNFLFTFFLFNFSNDWFFIWCRYFVHRW